MEPESRRQSCLHHAQVAHAHVLLQYFVREEEDYSRIPSLKRWSVCDIYKEKVKCLKKENKKFKVCVIERFDKEVTFNFNQVNKTKLMK